MLTLFGINFYLITGYFRPFVGCGKEFFVLLAFEPLIFNLKQNLKKCWVQMKTNS